MPDPPTSPDYSRSKRAMCSEIRKGDLEEGEPAQPPPPLAIAAGAQLGPQRIHVHSPVTRPEAVWQWHLACARARPGQEPTTPKAVCSNCRHLELLEASDPRIREAQQTPYWAAGTNCTVLPEHSRPMPLLPTALSGPNILLPSAPPSGTNRIMKKIKVISATNI